MKKLLSCLLFSSILLSPITHADQKEAEYAMALYKSNDNSKSVQAATELFIKYQNDYPIIKGLLGQAYFNGKGIVKNQELGLKLIKEAADSDDAESNFFMGKVYAPIDMQQTLVYLNKSAKLNPLFAYDIYKDFTEGNGVTINNEIALNFLVIAANSQVVKAQYEYGNLLLKNDNSEGWKYIKLAAQNQDIMACKYISNQFKQITYENKSDYIKVLECLANNNDINSMQKLAQIYSEGTYTDKNEQAFAYWAYQGAKLNDPESQYNIGKYLVSKGEIKPGLLFLDKSSRSEYGDASYYLGMIYSQGYSNISINKNKALKYLKKAQEQGNKNAIKEIINIQ